MLGILFKYHEIVNSMTLKSEVTLLDPFTHTKNDWEQIINFNFIGENSTTERKKVRIEETFCTLIAVGGKYLEKRAFKMVLKKINEFRIMIRARFKRHCTDLIKYILIKRLPKSNKSDFFL